jgi:putative ABC transport system ATP-binding protein
MAHLEIRDLTIEYTQGEYLVRPIDALNVDAADGEFVILLGPSGCGKTTLLSCLAGILTPTAGSIRIGDVEVTTLRGSALASYRRHTVGIVFQAFNLIPSLSARENVMAPLRLAGISLRIARPRAEELLTKVGLEDRMDHRPKALSGGQQQRVAIARALINDPKLMLADEPTGNLDTKTSEEVMAVFQKLNDEGKTIVVITHEHDIAGHAKRIVTFRDGRVVEDQPNDQRRV